MDEARRVLDRLERIEELRGQGAPPARLLPELRALMREGLSWAASERDGTGTARAALDELGSRLDAREAAAGSEAPRKEVVAGRPG
jgi:hypothetical protein